MFEAENLNNASPATGCRGHCCMALRVPGCCCVYWREVQLVYAQGGITSNMPSNSMFHPDMPPAHFLCPSLRSLSRGNRVRLPADLGWQPMLDSWLAQRQTPEALVLRPLFDRLVAPLLDHVRSGQCGRQDVATRCQKGAGAAFTCPNCSAAQKASHLLSLLQVGVHAHHAGGGLRSGGDPAHTADGDAGRCGLVRPRRRRSNDPTQAPQLESVVLFCLAWSLGGLPKIPTGQALMPSSAT